MQAEAFVLVNGKIFTVDQTLANEIEHTCASQGLEVTGTSVKFPAVKDRQAAGDPHGKASDEDKASGTYGRKSRGE